MKMNPTLYTEIKEGIRQVTDHFGPQNVKDAIVQRSLTAVMWSLLNSVMHDWMYDDTHPAYVKGRVRILPHKDRMWSIYDNNGERHNRNGIHDSHIETALTKIAKELGLTTPAQPTPATTPETATPI